jgi:hypothetical protein
MAQLESSAPESITFDELLCPLETTIEIIDNSRSIHHREVLSFLNRTLAVQFLVGAGNSNEKEPCGRCWKPG